MRREQPDDFARKGYEAIAALTWLITALVYIAIGHQFVSGIAILGLSAIPMILLFFLRSFQTFKVWNFQVRLWSPMRIYYSAQYVLAKSRLNGGIWLGKGFTWEPLHAKRMRKIAGLDEAETQPPAFYLSFLRYLGIVQKPYGTDGYHYVHGVGGNEHDLVVHEDSVKGHTYIVGTTGAGKTKTFEVLIAQAIARGAPVIVFDPKGDADLRDRCFVEASRHGRASAFKFFSLTHPDQSIRIDPLRNYSRSSNIANRIASLLPSAGNSAVFRDFAWRAINVVVDALLEADGDLDLISLRRYIEGDVDSLVVASTESYLRKAALVHRTLSDWESQVEQLERRASKAGSDSPNAKTVKRAAALSVYYSNVVKPLAPNRTIDNMVSVMMHDRVHYSKLISNLIPLLEQLTAGPLADLLSSTGDSDDGRIIYNFRHLITQGTILYINLDTLADGIVGQAVGSLFLADLTSVAAARYADAGDGKTPTPVAVYVDETAELINDAFIQNLNKGRGAGFQLTIASQTIADFVAKFGDAAMAMQTLGNTNMTIALRVRDPDTKKFVTALMGETSQIETTEGRTASTIDATDKLDYKGTVMKTSSRTDVLMVTEDTLNRLPNLHYFVNLPGGKIMKGRVPIMRFSPDERYQFKDSLASTLHVPRGYEPNPNSSEPEAWQAAPMAISSDSDGLIRTPDPFDFTGIIDPTDSPELVAPLANSDPEQALAASLDRLSSEATL